jgi:hypothetical protein
MPWSPAQHRLFEAAAHDPAIAKAKGIPQAKAAQMASEGIASDAKKLGKMLKGK